MSARTKIVVLHMKELIYTGIFAALGILLIVLLVIFFLPNKEAAVAETSGDALTPDAITPQTSYIPGIYTTELILGGETAFVEVIVNESEITSLRLTNINESVETMYPLLEPTFDSISKQLYDTQSLSDISYSADSKYTSLVLIESIRSSLEKASGDVPEVYE